MRTELCIFQIQAAGITINSSLQRVWQKFVENNLVLCPPCSRPLTLLLQFQRVQLILLNMILIFFHLVLIPSLTLGESRQLEDFPACLHHRCSDILLSTDHSLLCSQCPTPGSSCVAFFCIHLDTAQVKMVMMMHGEDGDDDGDDDDIDDGEDHLGTFIG